MDTVFVGSVNHAFMSLFHRCLFWDTIKDIEIDIDNTVHVLTIICLFSFLFFLSFVPKKTSYMTVLFFGPKIFTYFEQKRKNHMMVFRSGRG